MHRHEYDLYTSAFAREEAAEGNPVLAAARLALLASVPVLPATEEVEDLAGKPVLSAFLPPGNGAYHAPPWLQDKAGNKPLHWRVLALDQTGKTLTETAWQGLRLIPAK